MKQLVVNDELIMSAEALKLHFKAIRKKKREFPKFKNVFFAGDSAFVCDYFMNAVKIANNKYPLFNSVKYLSSYPSGEYRTSIVSVANIECSNFESISLGKKEKSVFFFFFNSNLTSAKKETLDDLQKTLALAKSNGSKVIVTALMPQIPTFKNGPTSLAERELSFYLEKCCEKTPELSYYLEAEKLLREKALNEGADVSLLRFDNIFAPDFYSAPYVDFKSVV